MLALRASDGEVAWSKDLRGEYGVEVPVWGMSSHPLVYGDTLVCEGEVTYTRHDD